MVANRLVEEEETSGLVEQSAQNLAFFVQVRSDLVRIYRSVASLSPIEHPGWFRGTRPRLHRDLRVPGVSGGVGGSVERLAGLASLPSMRSGEPAAGTSAMGSSFAEKRRHGLSFDRVVHHRTRRLADPAPVDGPFARIGRSEGTQRPVAPRLRLLLLLVPLHFLAPRIERGHGERRWIRVSALSGPAVLVSRSAPSRITGPELAYSD
jgi:hypothetical protein